MKFRNTIYIITVIFLSSVNSNLSGASFQGLGDLSGGSFNSQALDVSADGSVVVGVATTSAGRQAFRWAQSTGMVSLGNLSNNSFQDSWADATSADGSVIVGYANTVSGSDNYKGYRWTAGTGMELFGSLDGSTRYLAQGVSADGSVIVGDGGSQAFRWSQSSGIQGLGVLPGRTLSRALDASADGSVVAGSSHNSNRASEQAFRWTQDNGMQGLGYLPGGNASYATAVSPDGSTIVGISASASGYPGFRWTQSKGMVSIGHLPGMNITHAIDVSLNGEIIIGNSYNIGTGAEEAFIWDSLHGMLSLQNLLQAEYGLGTEMNGWHLLAASGITPDGKIITGWGTNPSGQTEAFYVQIPEPGTLSLIALGCVVVILRNRKQ